MKRLTQKELDRFVHDHIKTAGQWGLRRAEIVGFMACRGLRPATISASIQRLRASGRIYATQPGKRWCAWPREAR